MILLSIWWGGVVARARVGKPVLREVRKAPRCGLDRRGWSVSTGFPGERGEAKGSGDAGRRNLGASEALEEKTGWLAPMGVVRAGSAEAAVGGPTTAGRFAFQVWATNLAHRHYLSPSTISASA